MPFPVGASTITVTGTFPSPVGGGARGGQVVFTPSTVLVDSTNHAIYSGGGAATITGGSFSIVLLCTDDTDVQPTGWRWRVDEQPTGGQRRTPYWINLPSTLGPTVSLDTLAPVAAPGGAGHSLPPTGPAGGALTGAYPNPQLSSATIASFDAAGAAAAVGTAASAALTAHATDTTGVHGIADTAALETAAGATAKVTAHTAASDPHGDRADAASKYLAKTSNLADLPSASTARTNLGLGDSATRSVGSTAGTVAAGDDPRFSSAAPWVFDISTYGAVGDVRTATDGAMTASSAVLTCASGPFTAASNPVGKYVIVKGAAANGVTSLVTTIVSRQSDTQVTLGSTAATTVTGALVIWGTDNTSAIQAAVDAAEAYLGAGATYAQVYTPPKPHLIAGPLNNSKSGNGQVVFGVYPVAAGKKIIEFRGETDGAAAVRHWQQTVPQLGGSCWVSAGVFASTAAQITNLNADGNPGVLSGPNEGSGYGQAALYSNVMPVLRNMAILTTHSSFGLTYGAATFWGCANAHIENVGIGTLGTVASPSTDYTSPGVFGTGLSVGLLLPAPGNNDNVIAKNISIGGGYTYAMFITEHAVVDRLMSLYCWAGLVAVGTYAGSVGSVHAMKVLSASIEACTNELFIMGGGSAGVGPIIDIDQLSTESGAPNIAGSSAAAMEAARGVIRLTGLFNEAGVSVDNPCGIEIVNGQVPRAIKRKIGAFTCSPIDRTLVCDTTTGGAFTGTLPAADSNPVEYVFKNVGSNNLTVATTSSQLIYTTSGTGAATATVTTGQTLRVQALYNGTSWGWYAV